jgi:asparagine N-glycosylation enzyme membrane subunit Stt3
MRVARIALAIFPLTVVGAMAIERLALLWLGADPASPLAWEIWLNAHAAFGRIWLYLDPAADGSISRHLAALSLIVVVIVLTTCLRRWQAYSFLSNHIALILAVASSLLGTQAKVSSLAAGFASPGNWAVTWAAQFSPAQILILLGGVASCLLCHFVVLRQLRERSSAVALRVRMLQQNL